MKILFLFMSLFCSVSFGQVIVGNAGEGILVNERLFLRDFVEYGVAMAPYVGPEISPEIRKRFAGTSINLNDQEKEILLRKLTDIERIDPCFARILAESFKVFTWSFESQPLALLPEQFEMRSFPDEARVPVANRYLNVIHIHRPSWELFSVPHRVGLLLHEVLYAMIKPVLQSGRGFTQSVVVVRQMTSLAFMEDSFSRAAEFRHFFSSLSLPQDGLQCQERGRGKMTLKDGGDGGRNVFSLDANTVDFEGEVQRACVQSFMSKRRMKALVLEGELDFFRFRLNRYTALTAEGLKDTQYVLDTRPVKVPRSRTVIAVRTAEECVAQIRTKAQEWSSVALREF